MALVRLTFLFCDTPDCFDESPPEPNAKQARKVAIESGWVHRWDAIGQPKDYCPRHRDCDFDHPHDDHPCSRRVV